MADANDFSVTMELCTNIVEIDELSKLCKHTDKMSFYSDNVVRQVRQHFTQYDFLENRFTRARHPANSTVGYFLSLLESECGLILESMHLSPPRDVYIVARVEPGLATTLVYQLLVDGERHASRPLAQYEFPFAAPKAVALPDLRNHQTPVLAPGADYPLLDLPASYEGHCYVPLDSLRFIADQPSVVGQSPLQQQRPTKLAYNGGVSKNSASAASTGRTR